ncbi:MAG: hypothetical protein H0X50_10835 [Nitrosopumilus sp.]|nr:hypothetical protein [Nitrosopumilus sp.]
MEKKYYFVSPYPTGSKNSKSWVIVLPSKIVKKYQINHSTGFILKHDNSGILLQYVNIDEKGIPADLVSKAKDQPVSC